MGRQISQITERLAPNAGILSVLRSATRLRRRDYPPLPSPGHNISDGRSSRGVPVPSYRQVLALGCSHVMPKTGRLVRLTAIIVVIGAACNGVPDPSGEPATWARVEPASGEGVTYDVTAGGPGFVAVGIGGSSDLDAAVWTSPDGLSWTPVPDEDAVFGGEGDQWMFSVTAGGPGLVAVGAERTTDFDGAVWTSPDGLSWTRVPHDETVFGGDYGQEIVDETSGGPGLVAVGSDGPSSAARPAVWTSPDGLTWSRAPRDQIASDADERSLMSAVTRGGPGLVAVGQIGEFPSTSAAVWTSPDGVTWSRVPHDDSVLGGEGGYKMEAVTAGGPGLVAVGTHRPVPTESDAAVWNSPDGIVWSRASADGARFGGEGSQRMRSVTLVGSSLFAAGSSEDSDLDAAFWVSSDGITWSRLEDDSEVFGGDGTQGVIGATASDQGLVAVGGDNGGAAIWVAAIISE